jgi:hypothetical protein
MRNSRACICGNIRLICFYICAKLAAAKFVSTLEIWTFALAPEARLPIAVFGGPRITIGLFLFGWNAAYQIHWIVPTIGEAFFGLGDLVVVMDCTMYIADIYGQLYVTSPMASNTILRYVLGGTFPLLAAWMFKGLGVEWACTFSECLSVLRACVVCAHKVRAEVEGERFV